MDPAVFAEVLSSTRQFIRERVVPREAEIDDRDEVPEDLQQAARQLGLYGYALPEEYGGLGLSMTEEVQLVFELGYTTPALRSLFGTNNGIAGHVLMVGGTPAQQAQWLPRIASGEVTTSFALTEPEAGSDPSTLITRADPVKGDGEGGGGWAISGTKRYITNAPVADLFMVFARTDQDQPGGRGISAFLVPRGTPGLTVGPKDRKMGQAGAWTADVYLDRVHVGADALVGGEGGLGRGFQIAMGCLAHGRVGISAMCVGMAGRLVDESVAWATQRRQSGRPIGSFQLVQGLIADSMTDYYAGRAMVLDAARRFETGEDTKVGPSCAKYFTSEMVCRVADRAVQVHGGAGYMRGVAVERFYRDARLIRIYEGTSQIQQVIIARALLGEAASG
ncbi:MAG TPA: acyl-CoA dehydrogenase family protein [Streptosporangiaceae bacterium]|nr:acyl-CoA dehydrogenase family protein [Streptosporangiaceae bacterium]